MMVMIKKCAFTLILYIYALVIPLFNNNNNNKFHSPINRDARQFLSELGRHLVKTTRDVIVQASSFLFQRISVVVKRFNSVSLHDGFIDDDRPE